jgi:ATP-dependent DNA helicase RecG
MDLATLPVTRLKGVGPKIKEKLGRLGISTVQDVLFHLPLRYQDRTRLTPIGALRPGMEAMIAGRVEAADVVYRGRRSLICRVSDGTGDLHLRFFHFNSRQQTSLERGRMVRCYGETRFGPTGFEMAHPEYTVLDDDNPPSAELHLTPVYPTTAGIHQLTLRRLMADVLERYLDEVRELLTPALLAELQLPTLKEALVVVHRPPPGTDAAALQQGRHPAVMRLVFEELLAHQLSLRQSRAMMRQFAAPLIENKNTVLQGFLERLPYKLTRAQNAVLEEISRDLKSGHPMQRLVQGDVGSGKTVVSACACLCTVAAGLQAAVMAPTELLAEQHFQNFSAWFEPLDMEVLRLSGTLTNRERARVLERIRSQTAGIVVGTHALFQDDVAFNNLGLIVVDEQHRFGVQQRLALRSKGANENRRPHQLIMTATPIPRTLSQSLYADLDVSVIDELPPGRQPVETVVVPATRRAEVVQRVHAACRAGRQAYWVCSLIEESDALALQTATQTAQALRDALPELRISLVHGRMKPAHKERIMEEFKRGDVHLLVATTVVEVGIDVANASLMIIENAERLGLSQLHQLRGRIGRGSDRSSCVLMYQAPLSAPARERLAVVRDTHDGFEIAQRDLEMRGPGEMFGTRQTGQQEFRIVDIVRDQKWLPQAQRTAQRMLDQHMDSVDPIVHRWIGGAMQYVDV